MQRLCNKIRLNGIVSDSSFLPFWRKGLRGGGEGTIVKAFILRTFFSRHSERNQSLARIHLVFVMGLVFWNVASKVNSKNFPSRLDIKRTKVCLSSPFSKAVLRMIKRHEACLQRISVNVITGYVHNLNNLKQTMGTTAHGQLKLY